METLFSLLSRLPLRALHALGAALGLLVYAASRKYRQRLHTNAAQAGHDGLALAATREAGKMALELPYLWLRQHKPLATDLTQVKGFEHVQAALDAKSGVIFLTPHLGCFELCAQVLALHMNITVLYRAPKRESLKRIVEKYRPRHNLNTAPADLSGVRQLLRTLKNGGATGLLPDQVPGTGEGVIAPWFGKPALTMIFPTKLIHMSRATVLLVWAKRLPKGAGYELSFTPFNETLSRDSAQAATQINRAMEQLIHLCPTQYLWSYDRYKRASDPILPVGGV
jgi:Kdo2-lipid IVA lauroyltransferase/acyltransferase